MKNILKENFSDSCFPDLMSVIKIGAWDWNLETNRVIYSEQWAELLGYEPQELPQDVHTWERMVLPDDLKYANEQIVRHLSGQAPVYEAEFRMVRKDGSIMWAQDKGKVLEFGPDGQPMRLVGVLQDVSRLKNTETNLRESRAALDLAVNAASLGTWDWDIPGDRIEYNDEYLQMLGYTQDDINGSIEEWENMNHPDDLPHTVKVLNKYISGKISSYECEIRMKHKDGHYIWTKDVGRILERDRNGTPTRIIGGHLNIDPFKKSQEELKDALDKLSRNKLYLESEIEERTEHLIKQDRMLWNVNEIAKKLLSCSADDSFDDVVHKCLALVGKITNQNRVYIWKDVVVGDKLCCVQVYEWVRGVAPIQGIPEFENVPYDMLPNFKMSLDTGKCLNSFVRNLSETENQVLGPQGIKTILIAPVSIGGSTWGFIGVDNCSDERYFSELEENMLLMSGFLMASAILKRTNDEKMREAEERIQLIFNATPLGCNMISRDFRIMACNDEAVRMFGLSNQDEYIERFSDLAPRYQPCGTLSSAKALRHMKEAFRDGYNKFEWLHQKPDGEEIPCEVTLVRIKKKDEYAVAGYVRDLREINMLREVRKVGEELRAARDEALAHSRAKSEFLAKMSHEIRTPMNAIVGMSELILRESIPPAAKEHAVAIKHASANLLAIINDILDFSKIESGKLELVDEKYMLSSIINDIVNIIRIRVMDSNLLFAINVDADIPNCLIGDEIRLRQIILNVLSNAVKYTKEGYIWLSIAGVVIDSGTAMLKIDVSDSGIGIKKEDLNHLFSEFMQFDLHKNKGVEGTGLGLAITKSLCLAMGGDITADSVYGQGSTFTITVPQKIASPEKLARVKNPDSHNVLIYEPREVYLDSLVFTVENLNVRCTGVTNQLDFHDALMQDTYSFVLISSFLYENAKFAMADLGVRPQIAVLAEQGERCPGARVTSLPVYAISVANILNGTQDDFGDGSYDGNMFMAPGAKILIVDDINTNLKVAEGLMSPYNMLIDTCYSGPKAIELSTKNHYDIIFMDHMMPGMNGIEATLAIRDIPECKGTPIIALTANAVGGVKEMFLSNGFSDFLAKPIEMVKLNDILERWIPASKKKKRSAGRKDDGTPVLKIDGVDVNMGVAMTGGSPEHYLRVLTTFYRDGLEKVVELTASLESGDIPLFTVYIHALKSALASIGAAELSEDARVLEVEGKANNIAFIENNSREFLSGFKGLLNNLEYALKNIDPAPEEETIPLSALKERLMVLQRATEEMDSITSDEIINELLGLKLSQETRVLVENISRHILLCEYDEAVELIDRAMDEQRR